MSDGRNRTSAERWLFECLRAGEDDAAIARRMGLEPAEVGRWIGQLATEFEVDGRQGLVDLAVAEAPQTRLGQSESAPPQSAPKSYRRRAIIAGGIVAAAAGAYGAYRLQQGVEFGIAAPGPTATPEPSPTAGPTNTPAPLDVLSAIQAIQVTRTEFAPGEEIGLGAFSSVGYMDTTDGSATVWNATGPNGFGINALFRPLDDELDMVHMFDIGGFGARSRPSDAVLQLSRDRGWTWAEGLGYAGYAEPYLILRETLSNDVPPLYHVLEIEEGGLSLVTTLNLFSGDDGAGPFASSFALLAPDQLYATLTHEGASDLRLVVVGLPGGDPKTVVEPEPPTEGARPFTLSLKSAGERLAWEVHWYLALGEGFDFGEARRYTVRGDRVESVEDLPTLAAGRLSPDGRYILRDEPLREVPTMQGIGEIFPAAALYDAETGDPIFRVRSALLAYGHPGNFASPEGMPRWLADSSGFVARITTGGSKGRDAIFRADGSGFEELPPPPEVVNEGQERYVHGFIPAPDDPDLLTWSGIALYNRDDGTWLTLQPGENTGGSFANPWLESSEKMVFGFTRGSIGSGSGPENGVFLQPSIEFPPFPADPEPLSFEVAGSEPVGLWSALTNAREAVAELAPGTPLTILDREQGQVSPGRKATGFYNSVIHVSVRTADGLEGWVDAARLRWPQA